MADVPAHAEFVALSIEVANDPPANNTRGKTPANAERAKTPAARGTLQSRGRGGCSKPLGATMEAASEDDQLEDHLRDTADASQKRVRADTFETDRNPEHPRSRREARGRERPSPRRARGPHPSYRRLAPRSASSPST